MKKRLRQYAFHIGRVTWHVSRWTLYVAAALLVLLTVVFAIARYLLPMIAEQKPELELYLSQHSGHQVHIESLDAYWDGLHPGAKLGGLQVYAADGVRPAIRLSEVRLSLALLPLLWGDFEINSLVVVNPNLALERLTDGRLRVSGFDPLAPVERGQDEKFVNWLFQQGRLEIENGELQWFDHREAGATLHLTRVNLGLRNDGARHRLGFSAEFPPGICDECSLALDISGNPLASADWDGDIQLRTARTDIGALPLILREKLPQGLRGQFALQLRSGWDQGRPDSIKGSVKVSGLRLPLPGWEAPLGINEAGGDLNWRARSAGWRLDIADPVVGLSGPSWKGGHLRIAYQPEVSEFQIRHLNVDDLTGFVTRLKKEISESAKNAPEGASALLDAWLGLRPGGGVDNFNLQLRGDWQAPADFSLEGDIRGAGVQAYGKYPGARGVSGHLSLSREKGSFRIDSGDMALSLPRVFRQPLEARRVSGDLDWERYAGYWLVNGSALRVSGDDGRGSGSLSLYIPHDEGVSPRLKLRVDFEDGNGTNAAHYYPASHLEPSTLAWMERSFVGGEITRGYLIYDGPIRQFPFRDGSGKFELRGHVRRGVYSFLPGWEPVRQAEVDVSINNTEVTVAGEGKIGKLDATQVVVRSYDDGTGHNAVHVGGKVSGALDETFRVLRAVKSEGKEAQWLAYLPPGLRGTGNGIISLDIILPPGKQPMRMLGDYRFQKNSLRFADVPAAAEVIEGRVGFTEAGLNDGTLRATFLGGETVLAAVRREGELVIHGQGVVSARGLAPLVGPKIAPQIGGSADWNAIWRQGREAGSLQFEAGLQGLKVSLPPPLNRAGGLAMEKLVIRTETARRDGMVLALSVGNDVNGRLALSRDPAGWKFAGGQIVFGGTPAVAPPGRELHVRANVDTVDADQWWPLLGGGAVTLPEWGLHVSANVSALKMFDRRFDNLSFDISRLRETWHGTVNGAAIGGTMKYSIAGSTPSIEMDLTHLTLPDTEHKREATATDPRRLPVVALRSKSFELRGKQLGELDFLAEPVETGWLFKRINMTRPDMKLSVSGRWDSDGKAHETRFNIEFSSPDMGKTMEAFGVPDQLAGGEVSVTSNLTWPGAPTDTQLAALSGKINISAKKGRFLQVKAGAGRLFGLLDLRAIGRYLLLDFSPVFGKGLLYDRIQGEVSIVTGNAYAHGFTIRGPATEMNVTGRIGLAAEDFDLKIEVQPKISDTVTIATWGVLGPQVAAAVLAVQKLFKKQIAAGTRITYVVKGAWDNPAFTKQVKGDAPGAAKEPGKAGDEAGVQ